MTSTNNTFNDKKILIIGDVMIDAYIWGKVERISPEAPVPVVSVEKRENRMGGAANVALNIASLKSTPILASVIGNDSQAEIFEKLLHENNMPSFGLLKSNDRVTTTKFRIIGNNVQMLRVDEEIDASLNESLQNEFNNHIEKLIHENKFDAIIFEDYDKGVVNEYLISKVIRLATQNKIPILVDPKKRNFKEYKNVTIFKPNLKELKDALNKDLPSNIEELAAECEYFRKQQNIRCIQLTLGERGMLICHNDNGNPQFTHIPSRVRKVSDVSGAGDTVIAVAALALAANASLTEMAEWSNIAAGIVCEYVGVVPVNEQKLLENISKK